MIGSLHKETVLTAQHAQGSFAAGTSTNQPGTSRERQTTKGVICHWLCTPVVHSVSPGLPWNGLVAHRSNSRHWLPSGPRKSTSGKWELNHWGSVCIRQQKQGQYCPNSGAAHCPNVPMQSGLCGKEDSFMQLKRMAGAVIKTATAMLLHLAL